MSEPLGDEMERFKMRNGGHKNGLSPTKAFTFFTDKSFTDPRDFAEATKVKVIV